MANVPYPLTGESMAEVKSQVYELVRQIFEEKLGGADLGDVFSMPGDVLTLVLYDESLGKTDNKLHVELSTIIGGLQTGSDGLAVKCKSGGGLAVDANGVRVSIPIACSGTAILSSGTNTVTETSVTATSRIFVFPQDNDTVGALRISARTPGVSFVITSSDLTDSGSTAWIIIEP